MQKSPFGFWYTVQDNLALILCWLGLNHYVDLETGKSVHRPFQRPPKWKHERHFSVFKGSSQYVAMAKNEPFTCENPNPMYEPGDLWFEFGDTPEEALTNLKESLK